LPVWRVPRLNSPITVRTLAWALVGFFLAMGEGAIEDDTGGAIGADGDHSMAAGLAVTGAEQAAYGGDGGGHGVVSGGAGQGFRVSGGGAWLALRLCCPSSS
jgi:hypothetical protein